MSFSFPIPFKFKYLFDEENFLYLEQKSMLVMLSVRQNITLKRMKYRIEWKFDLGPSVRKPNNDDNDEKRWQRRF